jgi:hypothetical protein
MNTFDRGSQQILQVSVVRHASFCIALRCFFIGFIFNIDPLFGCSCRPQYPLRSSYADAKNIFIGKALQIQKYENWNRLDIQFEVESKFKGIFLPSKTINVSTPIQESSCGIPITVGQEWLVWAKFEYYYFFPDKGNTQRQEKSFLSTNRCDLTTRELYRNIEFLLDPPKNLTNPC